MNQSRREADETNFELHETKKDNERIKEDSEAELEKASNSECIVRIDLIVISLDWRWTKSFIVSYLPCFWLHKGD